MPRILKIAAAALSLLLLFTACAKKPEKPITPSVKIGIEERGTEKVYIADFQCSLKNDNDSTVLSNVTGNINIKDNSGNTLLEVPFTVKAILPYEAGIVKERIELNETMAAPLLQFLKITPDTLTPIENSSPKILKDENVKLSGIKFDKVDIIDTLKGKLNENKR